MDQSFPNRRRSAGSSLIDRLWRDFCVAAAFLTRVPVHIPEKVPTPGAKNDNHPLADLARASGMFPLVGASVGAVAALSLLIAAHVNLYPLACALIAVAVQTAMTGGLHEDGLADFADGLGGGHTPEKRLVIMRDSRIGSFGALALIFSVGLRVALLSQLPPTTATAALIAAGAISRAGLPPVMRWLPPARRDGLAASAGRPEIHAVITALVLAAVIAFSLLGVVTAFVTFGLAALGVAGVALTALHALGGQTGDVLGAIQQKAEILVLLAVAVVFGS